MNEFVLNNLVVGKITEIRSYGAIISFPENRQGLLHIKEVSDSFIVNLETYLQLNSELRVRIIDINDVNGFLKLSLKTVPFADRIYFEREKRKNIINEQELDFSPLEKALPLWIETAKKELESKNNNTEEN